MNFLTVLYGGQYDEITRNGRDGNKGRQTANVFLTVFLLLLLAMIFIILYKYFPGVLPRHFLRNLGPRTAGKVIALAAFGGVYLLVLLTVGSEKNFHRQVAAFREYPDSVKKNANRIILIPFFVLMVLTILLGFL